MTTQNESVFDGSFFLPNKEAESVNGKLTIISQGQTKLDLEGRLVYDSSNDSQVIYGNVTGLGKVVIFTDTNQPGVRSKTVISSDFMFFEGKREANYFRFSIEGLHVWLKQTWINKTIHMKSPNKVKTEIAFDKFIEVTSFSLENGINMKLVVENLSGWSNYHQLETISSKPFIVFESEEKIDLGVFTKLMHNITLFFCINANKLTAIKDISFRKKGLVCDFANKTIHPNFTLYYPDTLTSSKPVKIDHLDFLFQYPLIADKVKEMFVEWIKITESHSWELSEYTLMKSGIHRFLNSNFIDLTRVLEALHRHEYGNKDPEKKEYRTEFNNILSELEDPKSTFLKQHACLCDNFSFCNRMEDLLNFIPQLNDEKKESIAKRIRDTRNLLIHLDEDKKSHIVKGKDLWELTFLLETVFRINILKKLSVFRDVKDVVFEHFMVLNSLEPYCDN